MKDVQTPAHREVGGEPGGTPVGGPYAKIIADSISPDGVRLTTFEVRFHRFVLAEFNTHRTLSRNSASSRAIPVEKQVGRVREAPALPVVWPAEQKGMQGGAELPAEFAEDCNDSWLEARDAAVFHVEAMYERADEEEWPRPHKSVLNRLLEPFMWHTVVCTGTAWENFFAQRCSPLAQPEIRVAAEMMREAYDASKPREMAEGEWHLPYIQTEDLDVLGGGIDQPAPWALAAQVSAARCARVSYLTQDGKRDIEQDLTLYERLTSAEPPHWSPLEHVATPWAANRQHSHLSFTSDDCYVVPVDHLPKVGNLLGWRSLRTEVEAQKGAVTYR